MATHTLAGVAGILVVPFSVAICSGAGGGCFRHEADLASVVGEARAVFAESRGVVVSGICGGDREAVMHRTVKFVCSYAQVTGL